MGMACWLVGGDVMCDGDGRAGVCADDQRDDSSLVDGSRINFKRQWSCIGMRDCTGRLSRQSDRGTGLDRSSTHEDAKVLSDLIFCKFSGCALVRFLAGQSRDPGRVCIVGAGAGAKAGWGGSKAWPGL